MAQLIKIGNSKGIRITKALIEQADLENKVLELEVVNEGLLIKTRKRARQDWHEAIDKALEQEQRLDDDWLNADLDTELDDL